MNLLAYLQSKFAVALHGMVEDPASFASLVKPAQNAEFGDYQANCAMPLAKQLNRKPREVADEIVRRLDHGADLEQPEVAGPGFINLKLKSDWLAARLQEAARDSRLGVSLAKSPRTYVVDYSSPNVAKPLHVGHLRSTIIGEALTRILRFLGHTVITDNHLGDWGTQFGMLLYGYKHFLDADAYQKDPVRELSRIYVHVRSLTKGDADEGIGDVAEACRLETAKLHAGDPENVSLWKQFMPACMEEIHAIYRRLDVRFDHELGESFYNPMLGDVVQELQAKGIARESQGAIGIFREDRPDDAPSLIRKRDGAFTYTATDLATIRHRMERFRPNAILYVVDSRQSLHFQNLFRAAKRWGYDTVELEHISFGSVLGPNRKPLSTREGGAIELGALLDEAVEKGRVNYNETREERLSRKEDVPELTIPQQDEIAAAVGIGAVKYADLSQHRTTDYIFAWDKMLATDGNTATYMQYAYARCRSIIRKAGISSDSLTVNQPKILLQQPQERALALQLLRFEETLIAAGQEYLPHLLTGYLWDLSKSFSVFYQNCPVLKASSDESKLSRLLLCDLTARTIRTTLELLGIRTVEQM